MKINSYLNLMKWIAVHLSCFSMIFSHVAMGKEAEKLNKAWLEQSVKEMGLDKKITVGQFWNSIKHSIPGYEYKGLEKFAEDNRNVLMPDVTVDTAKNTFGDEVPLLRITETNGKTHTIQFFGEKEKFMKIDSVTLSQRDMARFEDILARLEASDIKLKQQADKARKTLSEQDQSRLENPYEKDFKRFAGFPRVNPVMWKTMTKQQRAAYIVKLRLLWQNAREVLDSSPSPQSMKPSSEKSKSSRIEKFYQVIFGQAAFAGLETPPVKGKTTPSAKRYFDAETCVVAGYVGTYVNAEGKEKCDVKAAIDTYQKNPNLTFVKEATASCAAAGAGTVACNPLIYGYPQGKPACINTSSTAFQQATHFTSAGGTTCDGMSRLNTNADVVKFNAKDYANAAPADRQAQLRAIEADQKAGEYKLTKDYLDGVLTKNNPELAAAFKEGKWTLALDEELIKIQTQFETEIKTAMESCEKAVNSKQEQNQKLACDQLHRRWLFTEKFVAALRGKACVEPAVYVGAYGADELVQGADAKTGEKSKLNKTTIDKDGTGLCQCPANEVAPKHDEGLPAEGKKVNFGAKCEAEKPAEITCEGGAAPVANASGDKSCPAKPANIETLKPSADVTPASKDVTPPASTCSVPKGVAGFDYEICICKDHKKLEPKKDSYVCKGDSNVGQILGMIAIGAVVAVGLCYVIGLCGGKKKTPPPVIQPTAACPAGKSGTPPNCVCMNTCAANSTINPTTCACDINPPVQSCTPPKVGVYPACACPAAPANCTLPQKVYNFTTCQCTDVPQPVICDDGSAAPGNLRTNCPKCPNGQYKPAGGCPNEGGNGNNCPQGNCNGGLPGTTH